MKALMIFLFTFSLALNGFGESKKPAKSGKGKYSKTQEVNFDDVDVQGVVRRPEGMYLVQKKGIDFDPLYKVRNNFDRNIKESVDYLR